MSWECINRDEATVVRDSVAGTKRAGSLDLARRRIRTFSLKSKRSISDRLIVKEDDLSDVTSLRREARKNLKKINIVRGKLDLDTLKDECV
jgi:hypothetical protein